MFGLKPDLDFDLPHRYFSMEDYEKGIARWCPGCGDHAMLTNIQKLCREQQLDPDKTVFVSGIGCSSRFPHYMKTYGFHGLHGRAFPVACGVKFRRPDLDVFVVTGDGDCCSIGTAHWIHAIRYNMDLTVMLFNNQIYGLTKKQVSPTSRKGTISNTTPRGSVLNPINPVETTLGVTNVSFVAQTADWNPAHMYATIKAAHEHKGFSFVHILQRCPVFQASLVQELTEDRDNLCLLTHEKGLQLDEGIAKSFRNQMEHDPSDIDAARILADKHDKMYLGILFQDKSVERYDEYGAHNIGFSNQQKMDAINAELDKYAV